MDNYKEKLLEIIKFATDRIFIMSVGTIMIFVILIGTLFDRQIVNGSFNIVQRPTFQRIIPVNAPRGEIFDVHGRPLAVNIPVNIIMLDPSTAIKQEDPNASFLFFINLMHLHGHNIDVDAEFFISATYPREFTAPSQAVRMRWLGDIIGELAHEDITAQEAYEVLKEYFDIPQGLDEETVHYLLILRTALYLQRFNLTQIRLGVQISEALAAAIEEHNQVLMGVYIALDYLRSYPEGRYLTNIIGFINRINEAELDEFSELGYTATDLFGRAGIEQAFEFSLRGQRGQTIIEVDSSMRRASILNEQPPVPGDDIYLTIDAHLQRSIYHILEDNLSTILINRLSSSQAIYFAREVLASMLSAGNININRILTANDNMPASYAVRNFVINNSNLDETSYEYRQELISFLSNSIENGRVSAVSILNIMAEQGIISISFDEAAASTEIVGSPTPVQFLINRIQAREITPQMTNIHPMTGSVVVLDINTGGVIAAVNYPTFDANKVLPHSFDNEYWQLINNDPTLPQFNRAFMEARAPGSTFKMITALAGLENGTLSPNMRISCNRVFTAAGIPHVRCWIFPGSHGTLTLADAIAVSCNYFFNRVAFDLGNHTNIGTLAGIETLNNTMMQLGLGSPTGVEIGEMNMLTDAGTPRIASPAYQAARGLGAWTAGDTSNVSIGQGLTNFTTASMAKHMATIANGGIRYQMHLLHRSVDAFGVADYFTPVVEEVLNIQSNHLNAIFDGMLAAGVRGTGANIFRGFPIQVGVKSGTAETGSGISHSSYTGFAPFYNPQIAVYVMIPFGDTPFLRASAGHVIRDIFAEYFGLNNSVNELRHSVLVP